MMVWHGPTAGKSLATSNAPEFFGALRECPTAAKS